MRRREFIAGLLGAAAISGRPRAARAQPSTAPVIGYLYQQSPDPLLLSRVAGFREGLREFGYVEGQNIVVEYRAAERADRLPELAAELVAHEVRAIVASGSEAVFAAKRATQRIPIVMTGSADPVATGLVASLARPGGNVTGMSFSAPDLAAKRLELLHETIGDILVLAVLWKPDDPPAALSFQETEAAAQKMRMKVQPLEVRASDEFDNAFAAMPVHPNALIILSAPIMSNYAKQIAGLALAYRLPAISYDKVFPRSGGLMSYGPSIDDSFRRSAAYVARILKGASPSDLPVEQPTKFELVANLKTAKALGLDVPPTLLARADEVIE